MIDDATRNIAADTALISLALMVLTFLVLGASWRGFRRAFLGLTSAERRDLVRRLVPLMLLMASPPGLYTAARVIKPAEWDLTLYLLLAGFVAVVLVTIIVAAVQALRRRIRGAQRPTPRRLDIVTTAYFLALGSVGLSIFCSAFGLLSLVSTAVGLPPVREDDLLLGRLLVADSSFFFFSSLILYTYAVLEFESRRWQAFPRGMPVPPRPTPPLPPPDAISAPLLRERPSDVPPTAAPAGPPPTVTPAPASGDRREWRERVRETEDAARRSVGYIAGILLGFSLLAQRAAEAESRGFLVITWVTLGGALFTAGLHDLLMTRWARQGEHRADKLAMNIVGFSLLTVGLASLLTFATLNLL